MTDAPLTVDDATPCPPRRAEDQWGTLSVIWAGLVLLQLSYQLNIDYRSSVIQFNVLDHYLFGFIVGVILTFLYPCRWRAIGFVPPIMTAMLLLFACWHLVLQATWIRFALSMGYGSLICLRMWRLNYYRRSLSGRMLVLSSFITEINHRNLVEHAVAFLFSIAVVAVVIINLMFIGKSKPEMLHYGNIYFLVVFGIGLTSYAWLRLFRFTYELFIEFFIRILYRFGARGDGFASFPLQGPVLVISNHACWWDPLFIAGELPRPMTAMMTASFYDIWFLRPVMKYAFGTIRVPETTARRETPEIHEAVAALNNGQCVVLFPEGYLRRKEDTPLRRFGRGIHEILKLRPETPVVACWIEGGWGSWCSWKDGPPVKGKKIDIRRKIDLGFAPPIVVPPELLENHLATRVFLMNAVSGARRQLGLEPLPEFPMPGPSNTIEDSGGV